MEWLPTGTGHELAIRDGVIVARNDKRELASVPAAAKKTEVWENLDALLHFLRTHDAEAGAEVERWLLRGLPVPRAVLTQVWADEAWRSWLTDLVISTKERSIAGFLRAATPDGLGVVDLDGESVIITDETVWFPHPALLTDLDELREFATELGITQRFDQLFREVHQRPEQLKQGTTGLHDWSGGKFDQLRFAAARANSAGFRVSGGYVVCPCYEDGRLVTARYWIGAGHPEEETVTDVLCWVCDNKVIPVAEVGPLAYSEGVRMASYVFAGRCMDDEESQ